jgi:hypothetical protein
MRLIGKKQVGVLKTWPMCWMQDLKAWRYIDPVMGVQAVSLAIRGLQIL